MYIVNFSGKYDESKSMKGLLFIWKLSSTCKIYIDQTVQSIMKNPRVYKWTIQNLVLKFNWISMITTSLMQIITLPKAFWSTNHTMHVDLVKSNGIFWTVLFFSGFFFFQLSILCLDYTTPIFSMTFSCTCIQQNLYKTQWTGVEILAMDL